MLNNELFKTGMTGGELIAGLALYNKMKEEKRMKEEQEHKTDELFWEIFQKVSEIDEVVAKLSKLGIDVEDYNAKTILVDNDNGLMAVHKESVKHILNSDDEAREAAIDDRIGSAWGGFDDDEEEVGE